MTIGNRTFAAATKLTLAVAATLLPALAAWATEVEFWRPYREADPSTYLLLSCDGATSAAGSAEVERVEAVGRTEYAPGKFDGALRLEGDGSLCCVPKRIFPGGNVAIEAWIKLAKYPDRIAYLVCRPAEVDGNSAYDFQVDVTKGFALLIDSRGTLQLQTTNCFYGATTVTSSVEGAVPLDRWVHVAGTSCGHPIGYRRLFVDGREVAAAAITWGKGLQVQGG